MKKLLLSLALCGSLFASELKEYISPTYSKLFDLELKKALVQSKYNSLSWISPVTLSFERSWSNQIESAGWNPSNVYSIGIDQPIFNSGGIYYGIKYAKSNYNLAEATTIKERSKLNSSAVGLLFQIKQIELSIKKVKLQIKNANIDAKRAKELFDAGLVDSIVLDDALVKVDEASVALLDLEQTLADLKAEYKKIGKASLAKAKLPKLRLLSRGEFLGNNSDITIAKAQAKSSKYYSKVIRSKYLPTVSLGARYSRLSKVAPDAKDAFTNYSLRVSMPISVNTSNELEIAKLDTLISSIKVKNSQIDQEVTYNLVKKRLKLIDKKIALAKKEARAYARVLKSTTSLYQAGQKSIDDVNLLKNSYRMKILDSKIYSISRSLELLKLYERVR